MSLPCKLSHNNTAMLRAKRTAETQPRPLVCCSKSRAEALELPEELLKPNRGILYMLIDLSVDYGIILLEPLLTSLAAADYESCLSVVSILLLEKPRERRIEA